jgi:hypothetical protein
MRTPISTPLSRLLLTASLLTIASVAIAIEPAANDRPATRAGRTTLLQQHFDTLDANKDGSVSRDEYQAWIDRRFDKLDTNHDGSFDADEVASSMATQERARKRAEGLVKRYDAKGTGKVTRAEFAAKQMQRFERVGSGADTVSTEQFMHRRGPRDGKPSPPADG